MLLPQAGGGACPEIAFKVASLLLTKGLPFEYLEISRFCIYYIGKKLFKTSAVFRSVFTSLSFLIK